MVATTISYCLTENQLPNRGNGRGGPPCTWQGLHAPVAFAHLVAPLPFPVDGAVPCSYSDDGGAACAVLRYLVCWGCS
jgi:hypothetical protein